MNSAHIGQRPRKRAGRIGRRVTAVVLAVAVGSGVLPVVPGPLGVERAEAQTAQDASLLFSPNTLSSTQFEKTDSG
ncbi:MAG: hypothetical protein OXG67_15365, partial [bacterium]|nr:hypothetical protein [bacterium]